jgi:hypothetical protein
VEFEVAEQSFSTSPYRFYLELFIVHPTLASEEISKTLGMEPHVAHGVGSPRRTPKGTSLPRTYPDTRWRHSVEHVITDQWFVPEVVRLIDRLEPHKAFFANVRSTGGNAMINIQFMDGFLADEIPCAMLARIVDLDLSLGIECFAGLKREVTAHT